MASPAGWGGSSVIVKARRLGGSTSVYSPTQWMVFPSGTCITAIQVPPTRTSIESVSSGTSTSFVPNQTEKCSGSVQAA